MSIHEDGLVNISESMIGQARKDFIRGGKILYGLMKRIPTQNELNKDPNHVTLFNNADVRWMYDAWRFVIEDPYQFFGDVGEEAVINSWKKDAILQYYKVGYLKGAEIIYTKHPATRKIYQLSDDDVKNLIKDNSISDDFIAARNYIYSIPEGEKTLKEWNVIAFTRSKHPVRTKRPRIEESDYIKNLSETKKKNIQKTKELYEEGMTEREIAEELELSLQSIRKYLRS